MKQKRRKGTGKGREGEREGTGKGGEREEKGIKEKNRQYDRRLTLYHLFILFFS